MGKRGACKEVEGAPLVKRAKRAKRVKDGDVEVGDGKHRIWRTLLIKAYIDPDMKVPASAPFTMPGTVFKPSKYPGMAPSVLRGLPKVCKCTGRELARLRATALEVFGVPPERSGAKPYPRVVEYCRVTDPTPEFIEWMARKMSTEYLPQIWYMDNDGPTVHECLSVINQHFCMLCKWVKSILHLLTNPKMMMELAATTFVIVALTGVPPAFALAYAIKAPPGSIYKLAKRLDQNQKKFIHAGLKQYDNELRHAMHRLCEDHVTRDVFDVLPMFQ